ITMPSAGEAWLTTVSGLVFRGVNDGTFWTWQLENRRPSGDLLGRNWKGRQIPLRAVAVGSDGHGYAVGERGLVLERDPDAQPHWKRLDLGLTDNMTAVTLPAAG